MRGRGKGGRPQLDLFGAAGPEATIGTTVSDDAARAVGVLKEVDVDRLTPLEALQLVAQLKKLASA
jgi:hypothetical protein